jgi:hypothetical protein
MIEAGAKVSENMFWIATQRRQLGPAVTAGIWWEKTRLRWSDRTEVAIGNAGNQRSAMKMDPLDANVGRNNAPRGRREAARGLSSPERRCRGTA